MLTAITRKVSPALAACELEFLPRTAIDLELANAQHAAYEAYLRECGARVISLPAEPTLPDSVFVEDPAVVLDEIGIITRTGAASRRAEAESLATALTPYRQLARIEAPGTLEGGDVLRPHPLEKNHTLYVGLSSRTNAEGIRQFAALLRPFGYTVIPVPVHGCLHLKSACSALDGDALLVNRVWIDPTPLSQLSLIDVDAQEPWGANVLALGGSVLMPAGFDRTREILELHGFRTRTLDISELRKAEAGVSCMSLRFEAES
jgi:dimethylargininase